MTTDDAGRPKAPDLREWIARYGGYWKIPWREWDAANAKYQRDRRTYLEGPIVQEQRKRRRKR
jgi:hypothetical protein